MVSSRSDNCGGVGQVCVLPIYRPRVFKRKRVLIHTRSTTILRGGSRLTSERQTHERDARNLCFGNGIIEQTEYLVFTHRNGVI